MASEYGTATKVEQEFKDVSFATGPITTARVERFIQEESAKIDANIGLIYTTPIDATDSPNAFLVVQRICLALVARRVAKILGVKAPSATDSQAARGEVEFDPEQALVDLREQKTHLLDGEKVSTDDGVSSFAVSDEQEHTFEKGVKQW